jgi:hypothetical protein
MGRFLPFLPQSSIFSGRILILMEQPAPRNLSHQLLTPSNLNKHAQRRGSPTRQALPAPSVLKKLLKGWIPGD